MNFDKWYHLLYISTEISLRGGRSKHQRKIKEIFDALEVAKSGDMDPLLNIKPIDCTGEVEPIPYCRYLLHCIDILKDEGKQDG